MRDDAIFNSTVRKYANGFYIPLPMKEKEIMSIEPGDDLEIHIVVRERIRKESEPNHRTRLN